MRIAFTTLGCKINQYETDLMRRDFLSAGDTVVPFDGEADVYIINTCSVTAKSDYQCRQAIRSAVKKGQGAKVVVTGCYAATRPDEIKKIDGVDLVLGNINKDGISRSVRLLAPGGRSDSPSVDGEQAAIPGARTRGFLKIQDGCDNRCSYCIVPLARGGSRSVDSVEVQGKFESLVQAGCPEIVLSGIHIGMYGADIKQGLDLAGLIEALLEKKGGARVRLSSIEPREVTEGIIKLLGNGLCRHLHIPLQSGDDSLLAAMRRNYTSSFYRALVSGIAVRVPGVALGADVMVGFPGEGEAEFQNTLRLIEETPLTHLHVFSYSPRPGTPAAEMKGQVPENVKKKRGEALRTLGNRKNYEFRRKFSGSELDVVVEGKVDGSNNAFTGITDNYIRVGIMNGNPEHIGKQTRIRITDVTGSMTSGRVCG